jgi:hypothetical protein
MSNLSPVLSDEGNTLVNKGKVLLNCFDILSKVTAYDYTNEDVKKAFSNALEAMSYYPEIGTLKRQVLKKYSPGANAPDHYAVIAYNTLSEINHLGYSSEQTLTKIKNAINNAMAGVHKELERIIN